MEFRRVINIDDERLAKRAAKGTVSIVDDEAHILESLQALIEYEGYLCLTYASVAEFLVGNELPRFYGPRCILTDLSMPKMDGLALQAKLPSDSDQPVIFMSGVNNVRQTAQAFRNGALNFLPKPIRDVDLFAAIEEALEESAIFQKHEQWRTEQAARIALLTERERFLIKLLPTGMSIKEMGEQMNISERGVKHHKKNLMDKLQIRTVFELVRLQREGLL